MAAEDMVKEDFPNRVRRAAESVRMLSEHTPKVGIILGSGLSGVAERLPGTEVAFARIEGFPTPTVSGHRGVLKLSDSSAVLAGDGLLGGRTMEILPGGRPGFVQPWDTIPGSSGSGGIMGSLPLGKAGVGSAVNDTTRELGGALARRRRGGSPARADRVGPGQRPLRRAQPEAHRGVERRRPAQSTLRSLHLDFAIALPFRPLRRCACGSPQGDPPTAARPSALRSDHSCPR